VSNNVIVSGIETTKYNYFSNKLMATVFAIYLQLIKTLNYIFY